MAKRKIITNICIGATVGLLVSFLDKRTRTYTKEKVSCMKENVQDIKENPDKAVRTLRTAVEKINQSLGSGAENVLTTLDKVEDKLEK